MENAPAMDAQPAATEQLAEAAQPAAEAAEEAPAPIAALQQAICDLTYEDLHDKQTTDIQNWFSAIAFPEDILAKLPRNYVDPKI